MDACELGMAGNQQPGFALFVETDCEAQRLGLHHLLHPRANELPQIMNDGGQAKTIERNEPGSDALFWMNGRASGTLASAHEHSFTHHRDRRPA